MNHTCRRDLQLHGLNAFIKILCLVCATAVVDALPAAAGEVLTSRRIAATSNIMRVFAADPEPSLSDEAGPDDPSVPEPAQTDEPSVDAVDMEKNAKTLKTKDTKDSYASTEPDIPSGPPKITPRPAHDPEVLLRRGIVRVELRPAHLRLLAAPHSATLAEIHVRDGEFVTEGQEVAILDTGKDEASRVKARESLTSFVDKLRTMDMTDERAKMLAETELTRAADRVRAFDEKIAASVITASFDGRITEVRAKPGQHLKQGDVIAELSGTTELEIVATIPSGWVRYLKEGHLIWVYVDETGKSYEAEFVRVGGKVDSSTRSIRAYAKFKQAIPEVLPGMSGAANYWPPRKAAE